MKSGTIGDRYRPDIDGLRAIAVLPVVLYHLGLGCPGGFVGVDIFYVISGYLITGIIKREIDQGSFTFAGFYERRVRRLFPALFAMLACVLVASWFVLLPSDFLITLRGAIATVLFSSNVTFWLNGGYFSTDSTLNPLLHTWSLAVEEQFYLLFPIFLLACCRFVPRLVRWITALAALLSFVAAIVVMHRYPTMVFYLAPFRAWELAAGCLLALDMVKPLQSPWLREVVGASGLALIAYAVFFYSPATLFPGWAALPPVLGAAMLLHVGASGSSAPSRLLSIRPIVYIGAISYSLYLWHWPLIVFTRFEVAMDPLGPLVWVVLAASLLAAMASYHLIEQPFRRRRVGAKRGSLFAGAGLAMCLLVAAGMVGVRMHGAPGRFDARTVQLDKDRSPVVPFLECDNRPNKKAKTFCVIGDPAAGPPSLMLWGDSHALAWAPGFDLVLKQQHMSAWFVPNSACPPLFGVHNSHDPGCHDQNLEVKKFIGQQHNLKGVVMAAAWNPYFADSGYALSNDAGLTGNARVSSTALDDTLQYLKDRQLTSVLLGPVPTANKEVPLAMALTQRTGREPMRPLLLAEHRATNAPVLSSAATAAAAKGLVKFFEVAPWFCGGDGTCRYQEDGVPLYRDKHHLSVAGAVSRAPQITSVLAQSGLLTHPLASGATVIQTGRMQ